jgi:hypothetical protein
MYEAYGVTREGCDELEARGIGVWERQKGEIAAVGKDANGAAVDRQRGATVADVTEDEAGVASLHQGVGRRVLYVDAEGAFHEGNG